MGTQKGRKKRGKKDPLKRLSGRSIFLGVTLIIILPLISYQQALDIVLMPQLFALSVFLMGYGLFHLLFLRNAFILKKALVNFIAVVALVYFLVTIGSSFFAFNYKESFFDIAKTFLFFSLILVVTSRFFLDSLFVQRLPDFFLLGTSVLLLFGFNEYLTQVLPAPDTHLPDGRSIIYSVSGPMAHKNLYASGLFMSLPMLIWGFVTSRGMKRNLFGLVVGLTFLMIFLLSTRAVWLGTLIGGGFAVFVLLLFGKMFGLSRKWRLFMFISVFVLLASGAGVIMKTSENSGFSPAERFRSIFDPEASNNRYRLNVWEVSLEVWKQNPIFGVGPGNWKIEAPSYFVEYGFNKSQLNWVRPHNDFLWVLSEKGLIGFLVYLALLATAFVFLFTVIFRSDDQKKRLLALLLGAGLSGYLVTSFFDFPSERIYHQTILALWFSLLIFLKTKKTLLEKNAKFAFSKLFPWILILGLAVVAIYAFAVIEQEVQVKKVRQLRDNGQWQLMRDEALKISSRFKTLDPEAVPVDYYSGLANGQMKNYEEARNFYHRALEENPNKVSVLNNLGLVYFFQEDYPNAIKYLEKGLTILPDYYEALMNLSAVYVKVGDYQKSMETLGKVPRNLRDERFFQNEEHVKRLIRESNN